MRTEDMQVFQTIIRTGSLRKAAHELGISQPSVTRGLRQLEGQLGGQLVQRTSRGASLTDLGRVSLPFVESILLGERRLRDEIKAVLHLERGSLRLGASGAVTTAMLIPVLRRLSSAHPGLNIQLIEAGSMEIVRLVADGELDMALIRRSPLLGPLPETVIVEDLSRTRLVVCVPKGHKWLRRKTPLVLADLAGEPLILPGPGYLFHEIVERYLSPESTRVVCRTVHAAGARGVVSEGLGITVATEEEASNDRHRGLLEYIPLEGDEAQVWMCIIRQRTNYSATVAERFLQVFREHLATLQPPAFHRSATDPMP